MNNSYEKFCSWLEVYGGKKNSSLLDDESYEEIKLYLHGSSSSIQPKNKLRASRNKYKLMNYLELGIDKIIVVPSPQVYFISFFLHNQEVF